MMIPQQVQPPQAQDLVGTAKTVLVIAGIGAVVLLLIHGNIRRMSR